MALTSITFVLFLCIVCAVSYATPAKVRYIWLLACSYLFYLYSADGILQNLPALLLMLLATAVSYACALFMQYFKKLWAKRIFLAVSLLCSLGLLFACKYFNFFLSGIESLAFIFTGTGHLQPLNLILPLGISYYTLQAVGYSIDVYTGALPAEQNPLRYALFVSFFPSLVTGPINRAGEMLPQYKNPAAFNYSHVSGGLFRVLWGLFKKMVIADTIGVYTASVLSTPSSFTGPHLLLAALLFSYQLYADFGGCCDIAIGAARMLGFRFAENFNRPFAAKTYQALWQRWHISLTSFLRDYVFTPLVWSRWTEKLPFVGKKVKKPPTFSSVIIIFAISGLWHGASLNYLIWGLLNGFIMAIAGKYGKKKEKLVAKIPVYRAKHLRGFIQRVLVYLLFTGCLIFFASSLFSFSVAAWGQGLLGGWVPLFENFGSFTTVLGLYGLGTKQLIVIAAGIVVVELVEKFAVTATTNVADWVRSRYFFVRWPLYYLLIAALLLFGIFGQSPFIYQQY